MNESHANPARLKDRRDQTDLVERLAGQAARDLPEPPPLSTSALTRIAMRIEERRFRPRALHFGRVLVTTSVLLGLVTVASAARMELMPRWIAKMVGIESKPAPTETRPRPNKARHAGKRAEGPGAPPVAEPGPSKAEAQTQTVPAPEKGLQADATAAVTMRPAGAPAPEGRSVVRRLAMARGMEEGRGMDRRRASAGHAYDHGHQDSPADSVKERSFRVAPESATGHTVPLPGAASASATSSPPPVVTEMERSGPAPDPTARPVPPPTVPAPVRPSPTPSPETATASHNPSRHLKEVVRALRIDHAPRTAISLLDRHAHELAGHAFAEEALLLRVEAMLVLKQQAEVLRLLDSTSLANTAAASVLLLTRGQLRAHANRCAEAVTDFDLALARTLRPSKQALLGRARCKQKLGDPQGAQADLDRLHREFPNEPGP